MGLLSLKQKIKNNLSQELHSEESVLYLIVEIRKYLERSSKNLGDSDDLKLDANEYLTVKFFRNWAAHPQKHAADVPVEILECLSAVSAEDNSHIEKEIFRLLATEVEKFYKAIYPDEEDREIEWDSFFDSLRKILSEQPVKLSDKKWVGYDGSLSLIDLEPS